MYAAQINDDGIVTRCIVATGDWATDVLNGGMWVESATKVGSGWSLTDGEFRPPQPYPSWTWEGVWTPPTPYPDDGGAYDWDEQSQEWVIVTEP